MNNKAERSCNFQILNCRLTNTTTNSDTTTTNATDTAAAVAYFDYDDVDYYYDFTWD